MRKQIKLPVSCLYFALSFLLPVFVMIAGIAALNVTPFGKHTLIISDANGLYINYVSYAARMFQGKEGVLYSFQKGLGGNMMTHLGGTMLNPFYLLFACTDILNYPTAFTWISVLNFAACGPTMYLLMADLYGHRPSNLIFSTTYALIGFNVANVFQVIFFTGVQMLPLMALGIRRIFQGKNPLLYILALAYCLLTNFYFGFVLCVASVILFVLDFWVRENELGERKIAVLIHYTLSSLFAGFLTILVWLPGFLAMKGGRLEQTKLTDFTIWENMPFVQMGAKLFSGANSTDQLVSGLPNIYVGILPIALVILFFLNSKINKRIKAAAALALGIYLLCFYIDTFNMLMHGGTHTNWFNYRYSFVFSFLLLLIASYEWQFVDRLSASDLKHCIIIMVLSTLLIFTQKYEFVMGGAVVLDFALLLLIFLGYRMYRANPEKNPKKVFERFALLLVCVQLAVNYGLSTKGIQEWEVKVGDYQKPVMLVSPLVDALNQLESGFFRMEVNRQRSETCGNDPMLYGYHGVGHGGSNERDFVRKGLSKLGVPWFNMRNYYDDGVPAATDALLGLKYILAQEDLGDEKGYTAKLAGLEGMTIYENPNALSLGVLSKQDLTGIQTDFADVFDNLNQVWSALAGDERQVLTEETDLTITPHNQAETGSVKAAQAREKLESREASLASLSESDSTQSDSASSVTTGALKTPPEDSSYISFSFTAKQDGPVFFYNRYTLSTDNGNYGPVIFFQGRYHKGDKVEGYLSVDSDYINQQTLDEFAGRFRVAYANEDVLSELAEKVKQQPVQVEVLKDSHLKGTFTADKNEQLLFTIPWDEGWTCWIDGERVEMKQVLDVFMAFDVTAGTHSFEMKYVPEGWQLGKSISLASVALLLLYLLLRKRLDCVLVRKAPESQAETLPEGGLK